MAPVKRMAAIFIDFQLHIAWFENNHLCLPSYKETQAQRLLTSPNKAGECKQGLFPILTSMRSNTISLALGNGYTGDAIALIETDPGMGTGAIR